SRLSTIRRVLRSSLEACRRSCVMSRRLRFRLVTFAAFVLALIILAVSGPVRAQSGVTGTALVGLNVRAGPSTAFDRVGVLLAGQTVELNGRARGWFRFALPNSDRQGWVLGNLLRITGDSRTLPVVGD